VISPRDASWVGFRVESDLLVDIVAFGVSSFDDDSLFPDFNVEGESEVSGIILEEIPEGFGVHHGVIDCCNAESFGVFEGRPEDESADTA
jgi:hypothetical protein